MQTQIFLRVRMHASIIYISDVADEVIRSMHMIPAHTIGEALGIAKKILGKENVRIAAIPDGVSVIVR